MIDGISVAKRLSLEQLKTTKSFARLFDKLTNTKEIFNYESGFCLNDEENIGRGAGYGQAATYGRGTGYGRGAVCVRGTGYGRGSGYGRGTGFGAGRGRGRSVY